jgi:hypothetical protein
MKRLSGLLVVAVLAAAAPARAQDTEGGGDGHWSVLTGRTVGAGNNVLHPEVGWPGIGATFLHGSSSKFDIGGRFAFDYGSNVAFFVNPGLRFQAVLRFTLLDTGFVSLALYTAPGIGLYFAGGGAFGILLPIGVQVGIHPSRLVAIALGFDIDLALGIGFQGGFAAGIPILFGPGVEFNATRDLAITFNLRLGPGIGVSGGGSGVGFAFRGLIGIALKL